LPEALAADLSTERWRDLVAALYLDSTPRVDMHVDAFRCLLRFTAELARQIEELPAPARCRSIQ
jgi:hypothetical protein